MGKSRVYPIVVSTFILLVSAFAVSAQDTGTDPRAATRFARALDDLASTRDPGSEGGSG